VSDYRRQSSSASRFTAGAFGFLTYTQCGDAPLSSIKTVLNQKRRGRPIQQPPKLKEESHPLANREVHQQQSTKWPKATVTVITERFVVVVGTFTRLDR
jgi:hypothetical protein